MLPTLEADSIDTCITDPPYELGMLGNRWDATGIAYQRETWAAVYRVLKPGAFLLCFGGTRTFHRIACAIEDAGFEIRDCLMWLYGSGFPKSLDIGKAIDKAAGAEREVLATLPAGSGPLKRGHVHRGGGGGLSIGTERSPEIRITAPATAAAKEWDGWGTALKPAWEPIIVAMKPTDGTFAANALEWGAAGLNIDGGRVVADDTRLGRFPANLLLGEEAGRMLDHQCEGASRFFYCPKASRRERGAGNTHPTVKPLALLEYLCTLTKPPTGGSVLDPFMGSGTTILAAHITGREVIGIEKEAEYFAIAQRRIGLASVALPTGAKDTRTRGR